MAQSNEYIRRMKKLNKKSQKPASQSTIKEAAKAKSMRKKWDIYNKHLSAEERDELWKYKWGPKKTTGKK